MCYTDAEKSGLVGGCIEDEEEGTGMKREDREAMLKYSVLNQNEELVQWPLPVPFFPIFRLFHDFCFVLFSHFSRFVFQSPFIHTINSPTCE
jgi:hypothetical protein